MSDDAGDMLTAVWEMRVDVMATDRWDAKEAPFVLAVADLLENLAELNGIESDPALLYGEDVARRYLALDSGDL